MSRTLFTAVILALANTISVGVYAQTQPDAASAFSKIDVSSPLERVMVPYTIDTGTVGNWDTLSVGGDFVDITGAATGSVEVPLPTEEHPIVYVSLLQDDVTKSGGGEDALVFRQKRYARVQCREHGYDGFNSSSCLFHGDSGGKPSSLTTCSRSIQDLQNL